jgi:hypothetical protein
MSMLCLKVPMLHPLVVLGRVILKKKMWSMGGIMLARESRIFGGEPVPVPLYPPYIHLDCPVIKAGLHANN